MNPDNYSKIAFPSLGIEINPPRAFELGALDIRLYGLMIALGLILAGIYGLRRKKQFGFTEDQILDGVLIIAPIAIVCARLFYCIFEWDSYKANPISILYVWKGGLAIMGAVIGATISTAIYCRIRKIGVLSALDIMVLGFLIGQCVGRWGNFFNREAVGALAEGSNLFLRMGLFNELTGKYEYFHPTFLYEALWNSLGLLLLHLWSKRRQYDGQITLMYCAWYGLGRAAIEGLRMDSLYIGAFRVNQLLAAAICVPAVIALLVLAFRKHDPAKLYANRVAAAEAAAESTEDEEPENDDE